MERRSFKILFSIITSIFIIIFALFYGFVITEIYSDPFAGTFFKIMIIAVMFLPLVLLVGVAAFINKDAPKYGMDKWKWMTIGTYVPNLLGLIIYLVVRSNKRKEKVCVNCGETVDKTFGICPYCGEKLDKNCSNCGKAVKEDWKVCPYCEEKL